MIIFIQLSLFSSFTGLFRHIAVVIFYISLAIYSVQCAVSPTDCNISLHLFHLIFFQQISYQIPLNLKCLSRRKSYYYQMSNTKATYTPGVKILSGGGLMYCIAIRHGLVELRLLVKVLHASTINALSQCPL